LIFHSDFPLEAGTDVVFQVRYRIISFPRWIADCAIQCLDYWDLSQTSPNITVQPTLVIWYPPTLEFGVPAIIQWGGGAVCGKTLLHLSGTILSSWFLQLPYTINVLPANVRRFHHFECD
jgi:hypothetical protein